jgi:hypothetical protein
VAAGDNRAKPRARPSSNRLRRVLPAAAAAVVATAGPAFAHASERGYVLLLPTGYYIVGGAAAVAASFLALVALPPSLLQRLAAWRLPLWHVPESLRNWTGTLSVLILFLLVAAGFAGSRDPLSNPLPLTVWTLLWVGLTVVQGLLGNAWSWIDPWRMPVRAVRALFPTLPRLALPRRLGMMPALILFVGFAWFELIDPAPDDPARLATAVLAYWLLSFVAAILFGHRTWSRRGEFLSVFFGMVSRFGVLGADGAGQQRRASLSLPGARLWRGPPLSLSGALFLLTALGSVSFDGLSGTFFWLGANGVNPLEFPGRTALMAMNTVGLIALCALLSAAFFASVWLGCRLAGLDGWVRHAGLLVWSIVPIALAYHFAHYLIALAVDGQYALVAISDPFDAGWNLFGTAYMQVGAGVGMGYEMARIIWNLQAAAIIGGHVLAVVVAHALAARLAPTERQAAISQIPLAVLMVGYTVFGLWLLSTPTAG